MIDSSCYSQLPPVANSLGWLSENIIGDLFSQDRDVALYFSFVSYLKNNMLDSFTNEEWDIKKLGLSISNHVKALAYDDVVLVCLLNKVLRNSNGFVLGSHEKTFRKLMVLYQETLRKPMFFVPGN